MKKIISALLTISLAFSLTACGGEEAAPESTGSLSDLIQRMGEEPPQQPTADVQTPETNDNSSPTPPPDEPTNPIAQKPTVDWERAVNPPADLSAATKDDFSYKYDSSLNGIVITKYTGNETSVIIPETIEDEPVMKLDNNTFAGNKTIEYIYFPNNLQEIHGDAFKGCSELTLVIPENIELTGLDSFFDPSVKNFILSDNMLGLNNSAYLPFFQELNKNANLETIKYNDTEYIFNDNRINIVSELYNLVTGSDYTSDIEMAEIWDYKYITLLYEHVNFLDSDIRGIAVTNYKSSNSDIKVTIPSEIEGTPVVSLGIFGYAPSSLSLFSSTKNIIEIVIPNTVCVIGSNAFENMKDLKAINISDNIEIIGDYAFKDCVLLNITLPQNLKYLGFEAFTNCASLTNITLPQNLKHLYRAFSGCPNIKELIIPDSIESIGFSFTSRGLYASVADIDDYLNFTNMTVIYRGVEYTNAHELFLAIEPYFSDSLKERVEDARQANSFL
ncbi:MAG: leucine-rich repeat domain-containing protein [Oscillospiraceae bacterium]|nr:leucine-rich repeat domain-containing protein [Oscillospiraceae bacterium]